MSDCYDLVIEDNTQEFVVEINENEPGPQGPPGEPGAAGPNLISEETVTALTGLLYGNGSIVSSLDAVSGRAFLEVFSESETQAAITAALASYTPTSSLAVVATSGSASDLVTGTLANARLSPQVVRSDFSYPDPAWITAIAASKLTGFVDDARLSGNVALKNGSNVFTAGNTFQASQVFDASIVLGGVTGPRIRAVSGVFRLNNNADSARAGLEISDLTATGNGSITGTLQIGGALGHLLRWNSGASSLEVRDSANAYYRKTRVGELQVVADVGGSNATPANARIGLLTQIGGYIAGSISGRTYSANAAHGDVIVSASQNMTTGQNDYSSQTDDLVVRGLSGNVEIARGLLGIGMAGQSARSISILPQNTGDRTGVRVYDYGTYATSASQSGFEVAYLGGLPSVPSSTVAGHSRNLLSFRTGGSTGALSTVPSFAIRSTIGAIIGSALSEVNTSLLVTPTSTGVPLAAITMIGQSGLVDFPVGQIQLGTNVRLKNNAGSLQARNSGDSAFANLEAAVITSAFQTLAGDPSTLDIAAGLGRLVKNTLTNEIAKFINDGGTIRKISVNALLKTGDQLSGTLGHTEVVMTPTGTTQSMTCDAGNMQTLNLGSATGTVALTITPPTTGSATVRLLILQGTTARNITWAVTSGSILWMGTQPDWVGMGANKSIAVACIWNGSVMRLAASEVST